MKTPRFLSTLALSVLLLGSMTAASQAQNPPSKPAVVAQGESAAASDSADSEVRIEPMIWLPTANASATIGDSRFQRTVSVNGTVTPSEVLPDMHISFAGRVEGRSGRWGGFGEIFYLSESQAAKILGVGGTLNTKLTMGQVAGFYRLTKGNVPVDLVAGVRIAGLSNNLDFSSAQIALLGNQGFNITRSNTNLYPVIGGRVGFPLSKKLTLQIYGDYGGFGIGNNLQTWRAQGVFGYEMNACTRLVVGYTAVNFQANGGRDATTYKYDTTFHGPVVGLSFKI